MNCFQPSYTCWDGVERRGMILVMQLATRNLVQHPARLCPWPVHSERPPSAWLAHSGRPTSLARTQGGRLLLAEVSLGLPHAGPQSVLDRRCRVAGIERRRSGTIGRPAPLVSTEERPAGIRMRYSPSPPTATQDQQPQPRHSSTRQDRHPNGAVPLRKSLITLSPFADHYEVAPGAVVSEPTEHKMAEWPGR